MTRYAPVLLALSLSTPAGATIVIPTNLGNGADAELRESEATVNAGLVTGVNRGASDELATRLAPVRSSVAYAKFDISSLPASSDTAFWNTHDTVAFDLFVRNQGNFTALTGVDANGTPVDLQFTVRALDPAGTYVGARVDRSGNAYTALFNQYDWNESRITFYDAPGIVPHCIQVGACAGGDPNDFLSTVGIYDDFDGNVLTLGTITPALQYPGIDPLNVGTRLTFDDPALRDLVRDARDLALDTVTLIVHLSGPQDAMVQTALNRNYLFAPKERLTLDPGGAMLDNSAGAFSPTLRIISPTSVPEPATAWLLAAALLVPAIRAGRARREARADTRVP